MEKPTIPHRCWKNSKEEHNEKVRTAGIECSENCSWTHYDSSAVNEVEFEVDF